VGRAPVTAETGGLHRRDPTRARAPGIDVVKTEYGKALGEGLYEFRIRWTAAEISHEVSGLPAADVGEAPEEILLRVFFRDGGTQDHPPAEWLRQGATFQRPVAAA
jgi:hypothetical protein